MTIREWQPVTSTKLGRNNSPAFASSAAMRLACRFATVLTLVFLPTLYVTWFGEKERADPSAPQMP
jgi:hypothetical protein